MADLASSAVSALLGVIANEFTHLKDFEGDVQFIQEEMESMNSFLMHLARRAPSGGPQRPDEQMGTWMNQVRVLARDCNNFIDLYLNRKNLDVLVPDSSKWRRCLLSVPVLGDKLVAPHMAADRLRELKERARQVGDRRLRYDVGIPKDDAGAGGEAKASAAEAGNEEDDEKGGADLVPGMEDVVRRSSLGTLDVEDYFNAKLANWVNEVSKNGSNNTTTRRQAVGSSMLPSIAIVAPSDNIKANVLLAAAKIDHFRTVMVDIPRLHYPSEPLPPEDILCYVWRELHLKAQASSSQQQDKRSSQGEREKQHIFRWTPNCTKRWDIYTEKRKALAHIMEEIQQTMKVGDKFQEMESKVNQVMADELETGLGETKHEELKNRKFSEKTLPVLLVQLYKSAPMVADAEARQMKAWYNNLIGQTAKKLKSHIEAKEEDKEVDAKKKAQYEAILRKVFLRPHEQRYTTAASTSALGEDQVKVIREEVLQEVKKMLEDKSGKKQATGDEDPLAYIKAGTKEKIKEIKHKIEALVEMKGIRDKIHRYLKQDESILIILNIGEGYVLTWDWEEIRKALILLGCVAGAVIVTASRDTQPAKEYCSPPLEPMEYSLVGLYHYIALKIIRTQEKMNEEGNKQEKSHVIHGILEDCEPHEFSMKIFAHALYANPIRSSDELQKLRRIIEHIEKKSLGTTANKMLKFSYNGLPREYKTCLLYLAIFSPGNNKIRRSTLIGRWVAEGLITTEDWRWQNSVVEAERCFNMLVNRCLVIPANISATGKVKSCTVDDLVHKFITKVAKKQRLVETRLSHHLAHHFSISNTLRLRRRHNIDDFFEELSKPSQFFLLKVLDLEDCQCFGERKKDYLDRQCFGERKKKDYLKEICRKILLLKYLSLKGTDVTQLPKEIKDLRELEVLDIRQTSISAKAIRDVELPTKLKCLLAGGTSMAVTSTSKPVTVEIPKKVEKMEGMEVLTGVKPRKSKHLDGIGKLWQLKKLCVVIEYEKADILHLLKAINDVGECLQSLSITLISKTGTNNTQCSGESPKGILKMEDIKDILKTKVVRSLSIRGNTREEKEFLVLLANDKLTKVTLSDTILSPTDLEEISEKLRMLQCVRLLRIVCTEGKLTFKKGEFQKLKYFLVEDSDLSEIIFEHGAACELEKIALSSTKIESVMGIDRLQKLEELELKNRKLPSLLDSANQISKVTLCGTFLTKDELQTLANRQNLRCLVLLEGSCKESVLTFSKDDLPMLNLLIVNCPVITDISFNSSSAPKLVKIAWTFTNMKSLSGIDYLLKLRELELNGGVVPNEVKKNIEKHKNKVYYKHNEPGNQNQSK